MTRQFEAVRGATRVVFGLGTLGRAAAELDALGLGRVLVVATPGRRSQADAAAAALGARAVGVLAIAVEHVPAEVAATGAQQAAALGADAVFAIGGGSAIGLAKAIALTESVRVVAAPTTYSGSEMTSLWGRSQGGVKQTGRDERVRPALVLYDPALTYTLPLRVTVASAWNAMAHAVEALWAPDVDPAVVLAAQESIQLFARHLPRLVADLDDRAARDETLAAAYLAAIAIAEASMGLHHKLAHVLGGRGMPHAETHAALLPHVVAFNRDHAPAAMARLGAALGDADPVRGIVELARRTGAPGNLGEFGLHADAIDAVARAVAAAAPANPRPFDVDALCGLLEGARTGTRLAAPPSRRSPRELPTLSGFGAAMTSEALPGAVPPTQNAPRRSPWGLYPELVSGVPFTTRRADNTRLWLYRIRPSAVHGEFERVGGGHFTSAYEAVTPNRLRWRPLPIPTEPVDFLDGLHTLGGYGDAGGPGWAVHLYAANASMGDRCFANADGDMLLVPQHGTLVVRTECGVLDVSPGEILLVPRGVRFTVDVADDGGVRGYVAEVLGARFRLPERGPMGSNGLADARHFLAPVAAYEDRACPGYRVVHKLGGELWATTQDRSPYDVVGWHGNHVPYKYDLGLFNAMGSVTFDHPDPSIHTVLTAPLDDHGRAICDFVCFRGRWDVVEHSFRPPFAHRNAATEVNGVVRSDGPVHGYVPGCTFLTPILTGHAVATDTYEAVFAQPDAVADAPHRISDASIWIMFESALPLRLTRWARETEHADGSFAGLFEGLRSHFTTTP